MLSYLVLSNDVLYRGDPEYSTALKELSNAVLDDISAAINKYVADGIAIQTAAATSADVAQQAVQKLSGLSLVCLEAIDTILAVSCVATDTKVVDLVKFLFKTAKDKDNQTVQV